MAEIDLGFVTTLPNVNELDFVDEDIALHFTGTSYMLGMPTQVQLNRNLQRLIPLLEKMSKWDKRLKGIEKNVEFLVESDQAVFSDD